MVRDNARVILKPLWYVDAPWCWGAAGRWQSVDRVRSLLEWEFEVGGRVASLLSDTSGWNGSAFWGLDDRGQAVLF